MTTAWRIRNWLGGNTIDCTDDTAYPGAGIGAAFKFALESMGATVREK
jgi:hypothetical protein